MAPVGDARDQLNAVQVHEGDAARPCKNGREWRSETVVESAATRALAEVAGEKSWMAAENAARRNGSCATARCDFRTILGERRTRLRHSLDDPDHDAMSTCERNNVDGTHVSVDGRC